MFEGLVEKLLGAYLGEWISDYNQLHLSVWSGTINLKNLRIRPDLFDKFKLPFVVHDGRIGSIVIHIPWRALRSEPVRITVERVYLLISPIDEFAQRGMVASSASSVSSFDELTEAHLRRQRFFKQSKIAAAELVRQERQRSESESSSAVAATSAAKRRDREALSFSDALLQVCLHHLVANKSSHVVTI
jgi:hypothetical protein